MMSLFATVWNDSKVQTTFKNASTRRCGKEGGLRRHPVSLSCHRSKLLTAFFLLICRVSHQAENDIRISASPLL